MTAGAATVVLCTVPPAEVDAMVESLLREGLCACVNCVGPVRSRYRWQGALEEAEEVLLVIKTTRAAVGALGRRIVELHSYQVPEVIELDVTGGLPAYLQWVVDSVQPTAGQEPS